MFGAPFVASFLVGPFVDRWNKAKVLRVVEFTKFCVVALMLVSHLYFYLGSWFFFLAIFIFSTASMFSSPALTALLPRVVDGEDLVKANAAMNIFAIISGLGLGAVLLTLSADELNFTLFYGVIAALLFIAVMFTFLLRYKESGEVKTIESKNPLKSYLNELGEGFSFIKTNVILFFTIAVVSIGFFDNIAYVNFPMFIDTRLGEASSYILFSFLAMLGGAIGSYVCRMFESKFKLWAIAAFCLVTAGAARIMFVNIIEDNFTRAILMYLIYTGLGSVLDIFYHVLIQKLPPKNLTGRVFTATTSLGAVAAAIGALAGGFLGARLYTDTVFFIQGGAYIAIGLLLCFSGQVRSLPIISELGKENSD